MNEFEMHRIAVGEQYPSLEELPFDAGRLELCRKSVQPTLLVALNGIRQVEQDAFDGDNPAKVGLFNPDNKTLFFIFKFGNALELDAPFNIKLIEDNDLEIYKMDHSETRILLSVILLERTSRIVKSLRVCTFSPFFTRMFTSAIKRQMQYSKEEIETANQAAVQKYSVTDMVKSVQFHKCGI